MEQRTKENFCRVSAHEQLIKKIKMTTVSKISAAFRENDVKELQKLWSNQSLLEMINFDFNAFCDTLGHLQVWLLPCDGVKFFVEQCGERFVAPLSERYAMKYDGGDEFRSYCSHFPTLIPTFEKHFNRKWEKNHVTAVTKESEQKAKVVNTFVEYALKQIRKSVEDGQYETALEACKIFEQYLESLSNYEK